jgi:hypothetical protein
VITEYHHPPRPIVDHPQRVLNLVMSRRDIPIFDKSKRTDRTFSREDFTYDSDA